MKRKRKKKKTKNRFMRLIKLIDKLYGKQLKSISNK